MLERHLSDFVTRGAPRRRNARGFTLAELMAVVAIMGVLATLGIAIFHRSAFASSVPEAGVTISSIKAAEEQYRALNQVYADVTFNGWYPVDVIAPNKQRSFTNTGHPDYNPVGRPGWRQLAPVVNRPVKFVFKLDAGLGDVRPPAPAIAIAEPVFAEPWYLVQARADADGDGVFCTVVGANFMSDIRSVNDGE